MVSQACANRAQRALAGCSDQSSDSPVGIQDGCSVSSTATRSAACITSTSQAAWSSSISSWVATRPRSRWLSPPDRSTRRGRAPQSSSTSVT